jgi:hypothetical protein
VGQGTDNDRGETDQSSSVVHTRPTSRANQSSIAARASVDGVGDTRDLIGLHRAADTQEIMAATLDIVPALAGRPRGLALGKNAAVAGHARLWLCKPGEPSERSANLSIPENDC